MQTKRKNGDLNKVLNEISAYLSDISNIGNITHYYWKTGIYAEKLLKLCYGKEVIVFPVDIKKITDKLGIWIEDVDKMIFLMNILKGQIIKSLSYLYRKVFSQMKEKQLFIRINMYLQLQKDMQSQMKSHNIFFTKRIKKYTRITL